MDSPTLIWDRPHSMIRRGLIAACLALAPTIAMAVDATLTAPGAPDEILDRLRSASSALSAEAQGQDTPQELFAAAISDYRTLLQVLYSDGYFSPVVNIRVDGREAANISPINVPSAVNKIEITVTTGPLFHLGEAQIAPLAQGTKLPEGFRKGEPASTGVIRDAAIAGVAGWRNIGYAKAKVSNQKITADNKKAILSTSIELLPGRELTFGTMTVSGNQKVRTDAIQKIAGFPSGKIYDPEAIKKSASRLRRTGTFASVSFTEAEFANPDGSLDFEIVIIEQKPRRISFGAEISSRTGIDLSAVWTHRNLMGSAERLQLEGRVRNLGGTEEVDGLLSARLDMPAKLGPDDNMFYVARIEKLNKPYYSLLGANLGVGVKRVFSDHLFAELSIMGSVNEADDAFGTDRKFNMIAVPLHIEWDRRDTPISATRGFYLAGDITPFAGFSGSASGLSAYVDARGYLSLTASSSVVLAGRLQLGSIMGATLSEISPQYLYYSGGAGTVRGQEYQSLGVSVNDSTAGGRSLLAASAEIRGRITEKISLVGFYDFGAVSAASFIDDSSPSQSGAGLGVRYDIDGFGPLRLDLALPVSGPGDNGLQFYIGIGQAF